MKFCYVPNPIRLKDPISGKDAQELTLREYALQFWLNDQRWQKPLTNMTRLPKVLAEFDKKVGEKMQFEDADYSVLHDIISSPGETNGLPTLPQPLFLLQLQSFPDCILGAVDKDPAEVVSNGKTTHEHVAE